MTGWTRLNVYNSVHFLFLSQKGDNVVIQKINNGNISVDDLILVPLYLFCIIFHVFYFERIVSLFFFFAVFLLNIGLLSSMNVMQNVMQFYFNYS